MHLETGSSTASTIVRASTQLLQMTLDKTTKKDSFNVKSIVAAKHRAFNLYGKTLTTAAASRSPPFVSKLMLSNVAMFEGTKNAVLLERNILSV